MSNILLTLNSFQNLNINRPLFSCIIHTNYACNQEVKRSNLMKCIIQQIKCQFRSHIKVHTTVCQHNSHPALQLLFMVVVVTTLVAHSCQHEFEEKTVSKIIFETLKRRQCSLQQRLQRQIVF